MKPFDDKTDRRLHRANCREVTTTDIHTDIAEAVAVMRRGGLILYPTDTVWGIGCDATNEEAVRRVFALKQREDNKALITLLADADDLSRWTDGVPDVAFELIEAAVSPLTIVYDRGIGLAPSLLGHDGSVGIRVTSETYSRALCRSLGRPVVSTSANVAGQPTPSFYDGIADGIIAGVDYVARYRRDDHTSRKPSSVIRLTASGVVTILRK